MKIHLVQSEVLLLQSIGYVRKLIREQRTQISFFAANEDANFVGMHDSANLHIAEGRRVHPDPHFRLRRFVYDLRQLHGAGRLRCR